MKKRNGFVSNSSTSSFVCDICGNVESGYDLSLEDAGMTECTSGHCFDIQCGKKYMTQAQKAAYELIRKSPDELALDHYDLTNDDVVKQLYSSNILNCTNNTKLDPKEFNSIISSMMDEFDDHIKNLAAKQLFVSGEDEIDYDYCRLAVIDDIKNDKFDITDVNKTREPMIGFCAIIYSICNYFDYGYGETIASALCPICALKYIPADILLHLVNKYYLGDVPLSTIYDAFKSEFGELRNIPK